MILQAGRKPPPSLRRTMKKLSMIEDSNFNKVDTSKNLPFRRFRDLSW